MLFIGPGLVDKRVINYILQRKLETPYLNGHFQGPSWLIEAFNANFQEPEMLDRNKLKDY